MKLSLKKFKCYKKLELEIPIGAIVLLKGKSGGGKSTILKSIDWVLYGNVKKITPHLLSNAKTVVKYEYNGITITRFKNPNHLIYDDGNTLYEDAEAQKKINYMYGESDVFASTSFLSQRMQNFFLSASNANKLILLNKICFQDQDPNEYLDKIENYYNEARTLQQCQLDLFKIKSQQIEPYDINVAKHALSANQIDLLQQKLISLYEKEKLLIELKNKQNIAIAIKKNKEEEFNNIMIDNEPLSLHLSFDIINGTYLLNNDNLLNLERHYHEFKAIYNINEQKSKIETQLKDVLLIKKSFTLVDLQESISNEKIYEENDTLFKQLDLTHNIDDINDYIAHLNELLAAQDTLIKQQQLSELNKKYQLLPNNVVNDEQYDTNHLENEVDQLVLEQGSLQHQLQHLIEAQTAIQCPYCEEEVLYKNGKLTKIILTDNLDIDEVNKRLKTIKDSIINHKQNIDQLKLEHTKVKKLDDEQSNTKNHLLKNIEKLKKEIDQLPTTDIDQILNTKEKDTIYKTLLKLKNVKIVSLPIYKSNEIKEYFKNKEEYDKQQHLLEQYNALPTTTHNVTNEDLTILNDYIKKYKIQLNKLITQKERQQLLIKQINDIVIEDVEDVDIVKLEILNIIEKIDKSNKALTMIDQQIQLSQEKDILIESTYKANNLGQLKQIASDIECRVLEGLISTISSHVYDVCQNMFDQEIKIEINLYKLLKSSRVKPCVNFTVIYKGGKFENISDLSFGEYDRTSLAMTLALNRISTGHIIMFDETLKSLNIELQMDVVKTIRENCNSTVFIVDHDGLEGMFDHVIDVDQLDHCKIIAS